MPSIQLTDLTIRALKSDAQIDYWDSNLPGFGIRIGKRAKTFMVKRDNHRINIGRYPTLSLADAKKKAKRILAGIEETPKPKRSGVKFEVALAEFLEQHYADKRPRVKAEAKRQLEKHFLPAFKASGIDTVTDAQIGDELAKLADRRSEQLHAFRIVRTFLNWCVRPPRRYITSSPLAGYEAPSQDTKRKRKLSDEELAKIWEAAGSHRYGPMVQLLILWGARNGEAIRPHDRVATRARRSGGGCCSPACFATNSRT